MLFQVQRHLVVRHPAGERPDQEAPPEARDGGVGEEAESQYRAGPEPEPVHAPPGEKEKEQRAGQHNAHALQRDLEPPAVPHPADDGEERLARGPRIHPLAPFSESRFDTTVSPASSRNAATKRYHQTA